MLTKRPLHLAIVALMLIVALLVACSEGATQEPAAEEPAAEAAEEEAMAEEPTTEEEAAEEPTEEPADEEEPAAEVEPAADEGAQPVVVYDDRFGAEPDLCNPADPVLTDVVEVAQIEETDSTILDGQTSLFMDYVNDLGQTFRITVDGTDLEVAEAYLNELAVCFEAIDAGPPADIEASSVSLDEPFIAALLDNTGLELAELQERRGALLSQGGATLEMLLAEAGFEEVGPIFDDAVQRAYEAIDAAMEEGQLPPEEWDYLQEQVPILYRDWLTTDETMAAIDPSQEEPLDFPRELQEDPRTLVVSFEWLDQPEEEQVNFAVFFAIDPSIGQNSRRWYSWRNQRYVYAYLKVTQGRVSLGMWRWDGSYQKVGYTTVSAVGWTNTLSQYSSTSRWYRVHTYGRHSSNYYIMYGTWR